MSPEPVTRRPESVSPISKLGYLAGWKKPNHLPQPRIALIGSLMPTPARPTICHIVHVDRPASIVRGGSLLCDAAVLAQATAGTTIGISDIKRRCLQELQLTRHAGLFVGQCVPFYFCPSSIILFFIYCANHAELDYKDGHRSLKGPFCSLTSSRRSALVSARPGA